MKSFLIGIWLLIFSLIFVGNVVAEEEPDFSSIKPIWNTCVSCHGAQGQGGVGPQLQGANAEYIIEALTVYKQGGERLGQAAMMWPFAKNLTEEQIETIGKYIEAGFPNK